MTVTATKRSTAKKTAAKAPEPEVEVEAPEGEETKVGPLHEAHSAYILRTKGVEVDPEAIFLVYSTRVAFRKTSDEYRGVAAAKAALKAEALAAKEAAKAAKAAEREAAAAAKAEARAEKTAAANAAKAEKAEQAAIAKAAKAAEAEKAKAAKGKQTSKDALADADKADTSTSKPKKGKAAF